MRLQQPVRVVASAPAELHKASCCPAAPGDPAELPRRGRGEGRRAGCPPHPVPPEGQDPRTQPRAGGQSRGGGTAPGGLRGSPGRCRGTYVPGDAPQQSHGQPPPRPSADTWSIPTASPSPVRPLPEPGRPLPGKAQRHGPARPFPAAGRIPPAAAEPAHFKSFFPAAPPFLLPLGRRGGRGGRCASVRVSPRGCRHPEHPRIPG